MDMVRTPRGVVRFLCELSIRLFHRSLRRQCRLIRRCACRPTVLGNERKDLAVLGKMICPPLRSGVEAQHFRGRQQRLRFCGPW